MVMMMMGCWWNVMSVVFATKAVANGELLVVIEGAEVGFIDE